MKGRRPTQLAICRACKHFVRPTEADCPFCGRNLIESAIAYNATLAEAQRAAEQLEQLLAELMKASEA